MSGGRASSEPAETRMHPASIAYSEQLVREAPEPSERVLDLVRRMFAPPMPAASAAPARSRVGRAA